MNIKTPKDTIKDVRILKIYSKYIARFRSPLILPQILLQGIWLKKLGFECGQSITVRTEKNRIVITNSEKIIIRL